MVYKIIDKTASLLPLSTGLELTKTDIILPFYHLVSNENPVHIKHLYRVKKTNDFINDLDFFCKYFEPIDYPTFCKIKNKEIKPKKKSFLLSFDDGLVEFYDIIAPILLKKGIPAINFLNSNFIDNKDLFYRYKASLLIDFLTDNQNQLPFTPFSSIEEAKKNILAINYTNKKQLDIWAKKLNFSFADFLQKQKPYLTTEQIKELQQQGFYFGTHSIDHPEYFRLTLEEQKRQTKESMEEIQKEFNISYKIFAFPFTDFNISKKFFETIDKEKICDTTFGTAGIKKDTVPNNFQRIPMEVGNCSAKQILKRHIFLSIIKELMGRNKIIRQ